MGDTALPITVRFGDREFEVEGAPAALRQLAALVHSPAELVAQLTPARSDPSSYKGFVRSIRIRPDERKVRVQRLDDQLLLSGTMSAREILAANLNNFADGPSQPGDHLHVQFFPGHYYLEEGSLPFVVSRQES